MFRTETIGAEVGAEEVRVRIALGRMICLKNQFVLRCRCSQKEAKMDDAQDYVVKSARNRAYLQK